MSTATSTMSAVVPARAMWSRTDVERSLTMCAGGRRAGTAVEARAAMCFVTARSRPAPALKACCLSWLCFNCQM